MTENDKASMLHNTTIKKVRNAFWVFCSCGYYDTAPWAKLSDAKSVGCRRKTLYDKEHAQ